MHAAYHVDVKVLYSTLHINLTYFSTKQQQPTDRFVCRMDAMVLEYRFFCACETFNF